MQELGFLTPQLENGKAPDESCVAHLDNGPSIWAGTKGYRGRSPGKSKSKCGWTDVFEPLENNWSIEYLVGGRDG